MAKLYRVPTRCWNGDSAVGVMNAGVDILGVCVFLWRLDISACTRLNSANIPALNVDRVTNDEPYKPVYSYTPIHVAQDSEKDYRESPPLSSFYSFLKVECIHAR